MRIQCFILLFLFCQTLLAQLHYDSHKDKWFTNLSDALKTPYRVYQLDLSNQSLKEIPEEIKDFQNLTDLNLSDNQLSDLDFPFKKLRKLEYLDLTGNQITQIDFKVFSSNPELKILKVRKNGLENLGPTICHLTYIGLLDLGENKIKDLDDISCLTHLKKLWLDNNELNKLLAIPKSLQHLNLNANQIEEFTLKDTYNNLISLDLSDNPSQSLKLLMSGSKLKKLILDWLPLNQFTILEPMEELKILSLEHCQISESFNVFSAFPNLEELSLMNNNFSELPEHLRNHKKLKKLWSSENPDLSMSDFDSSNSKFEILMGK